MFEQLVEAVLQAGRQMKQAANIESHQKTGFRDIVTQYDVNIQNFLQAELRNIAPYAGFIGEESGQEARLTEACFICDPIDGTSNFRFGLMRSACSLAYLENGVTQIGITYDPYTDELFTAQRGKGAYCNGKPIKALQGTMENGITIFGTNPYYANTVEDTFALAKLCYQNTMDLRRFGAATLDLCYVAAGRAILFFEGSLAPWDFAAGKLIAEECGLVCKDWQGKDIAPLSRSSIVCGNPAALEQWFALYKQVKKEQ